MKKDKSPKGDLFPQPQQIRPVKKSRPYSHEEQVRMNIVPIYRIHKETGNKYLKYLHKDEVVFCPTELAYKEKAVWISKKVGAETFRALFLDFYKLPISRSRAAEYKERRDRVIKALLDSDFPQLDLIALEAKAAMEL